MSKDSHAALNVRFVAYKTFLCVAPSVWPPSKKGG